MAPMRFIDDAQCFSWWGVAQGAQVLCPAVCFTLKWCSWVLGVVGFPLAIRAKRRQRRLG